MPTKVVRKESTEPRMQQTPTILTRRNQQMLNQKLKSVDSTMSFLDVDALQQQESEWIKIGVDTGAGKTAWPQSVTYGKTMLTALSAPQLESLSKVASECKLWVETIEIDAMPLSWSSGGSRPGPNL